ncbi:MAG: Replication factor A protein 1 [Thelocarpon superellum]|nr:MAG: Replication factor A protein 1 [Thelocarpon superellum]
MASDAESHISKGSLTTIFNAGTETDANALQPVLQCLQIKPLASQQQNGPERFRVVFSDVNNFAQSMLATQINWVIHDGKLKKGCLVRLKGYSPNIVKGKRILIVLDLDVLEEFGEVEKIGDPKALEVKSEEEESKAQPTTISSNGFYGNKAAAGSGLGGAPSLPSRHAGGSSAHANIYPIESISPYTHKWTIKARCTSKGEIKHWHNKNGEGKLFSVNLLDDSGEIRATGFNEQCDALYELFQEGGVYYISTPCKTQLAKKQFTNLNNDYELTFERDTMVEKAEDQADVPQVRFNFTNIGELQNVEKDTTIDVIGVLKEVGEVSQITSKTTSKPYDKRELTLVDSSGFSVRLTVWGATANTFDTPEDSVIAFKGLKVSDFGGRSLSLLSSGSMTVDPDIDEAHKLKGWYDAQGRSDTFATHASMGAAAGAAGGRKDVTKTIAQVKDENLGMSDEVDYFTTKATVIYIRQENVSYPACLSEGCNKKVVELDPGQWRCEKCDKTHPRPEYRYIMSINVSDHTGQIWLSCFDDTGRLLMGVSADQLNELRESDEKAAGELFQKATCKTWIFRCRAKMDNYQDQQRVRYQVSSANAINYPAECAKLAETLQLYSIE